MFSKLDTVPEVRGEIKERALLNAARLCAPIYRPEAIFTQDQAGWPGDWEGRTLLALVSHLKVLGTQPAYLDATVRSISGHLNEKGYLGPVRSGVFDEQQLSGHNWLLRGLIEYYLVSGDKNAFELAGKIVQNLYLDLIGCYSCYPVEPGVRESGGSYSGNVSGTFGKWILSTDVGCAFMCLDGLSQYYAVTGDSRVFELLKEMVSVYSSIDFVKIKMQTHATLSALRGVLRLYESTGDRSFLETSVKVFDLYEKYGMTENYANFNWFGRYDTWTEPCAITDSMMAATELFRFTGNMHYLTVANRIYFNAFCYAQRFNGGFGTDTAVGPAGRYLRPSGQGISEAYWCCTMRGAEGISYIAEHSVMRDENGNYIVPFGGSFSFSDNGAEIDFSSSIPYNGEYTINAASDSDNSFSIGVFGPDGFSEHFFTLKKGQKSVHTGSFEINTRAEMPFTVSSGRKHFFGDLLLGTNNPSVLPLYRDLNAEGDLQPLTNMKDVSAENTVFENRQIVFD